MRNKYGTETVSSSLSSSSLSSQVATTLPPRTMGAQSPSCNRLRDGIRMELVRSSFSAMPLIMSMIPVASLLDEDEDADEDADEDEDESESSFRKFASCKRSFTSCVSPSWSRSSPICLQKFWGGPFRGPSSSIHTPFSFQPRLVPGTVYLSAGRGTEHNNTGSSFFSCLVVDGAGSGNGASVVSSSVEQRIVPAAVTMLRDNNGVPA
mmetsp:Transcript_15503/g.35728  ORF Transcript_15503/g.35728 Transcript_15503/m.35728 type:complete len:208 (-) Transcript_15503:310-933(-)